jgi:transcriptional regulator with XRE-family HTH domain
VARRLLHPRPKQGAHLVAQKAKRLTQLELALAVGETQQNIAFWEKFDHPPRSDVLPKLAKVLGVRIEDFIVTTAAATLTKQQPVGEIQKTFDEVRKLPRRQHRHVIEHGLALRITSRTIHAACTESCAVTACEPTRAFVPRIA